MALDQEKQKWAAGSGAWQLLLPGRKNKGLPLIFLLLLFLPLANQVFHFIPAYELDEKRRLADRPVYELAHPFLFARRYEAYYNDHFSFRTRLVYWNSLLTYRIFGVAASDKVIVGKKGWLFMGNVNPYFNEVDYYRNLTPFSEEQLGGWRILLEQRRDWLKRRGIHYLFVVAPNKSTIYSEYMPDWVFRIGSRTRLDQLLDYMRAHSTVDILDLRPALLAAKRERQVYHLTDSHWNDIGGYVAYREIIRRLRKYYDFIQPRPIAQFWIRQSGPRSGDLTAMMSLPTLLWEKEWQMEPKTATPVRIVFESDPKRRNKLVSRTTHVCAGAPLPAALMVHDSFAHQMKQFLSRDFSRITYIWDWAMNFYDKVIRKEKIAIVIDQMVEYSLLPRFPTNPLKLRR